MPKPILSKSRAPSLSFKTYTFKSSAQPGETFTFNLRALSELERFSMREFAQDLVARYVTGGIIDPGDNLPRKTAEILALIEQEDGSQKPATASVDAMYCFAELERMQGVKRDIWDDTPRDNAFIAAELAVIAETEPWWDDLRRAVIEVKTEAAKKKARENQDSDGKLLSPDSKPDGDTPLSLSA